MRKITWLFPTDAASVREKLPRADVSIESVGPAVAKLIEEVRTNGRAALESHAEQFDGVAPEEFRVAQQDLDAALKALDPKLRTAIEEAIARVRLVSRTQLPEAKVSEPIAGGKVTTRFVPVDSVGLYVPGGKAVYPSSTIMNVVPAQIAGVPRLAIATPAQKEFGGRPNPTILATAKLLGVDEVYAIGGASAIAAFAHGVEEIGLEPVRLVTGPGNIYVAAAKRQLRSQIGIDSEAGPTEILIIADQSANPKFVAADLISQAEHDENAASVLLSTSQQLLDDVEVELQTQIALAANKERISASLSGIQSALVLVSSIEQAIEIANQYATEHLEIMTEDAQGVADQITNAGAIFLGDYSPVSLGDYLAGSNHVLPTGEQAKFSSGLNVLSFLRSQQVVDYSAAALGATAGLLADFAHAESLSAHGDAAQIRFKL